MADPRPLRPVVVVDAGRPGPGSDVLAGGADREPLWRRVPPRTGVALAAAAVLAGGLVTLASGAAVPPVVPPPPLGVLGPVVAGRDDGQFADGLVRVRVEAELRTREPVVLRSGLVEGADRVVLLDAVPTPSPEAPDAVTSRVVALVDPACSADEPPSGPAGSALRVVVAPQDGGEPVTLTGDVPLRAFRNAASSACAPVQASATLPPGSGPAAEAIAVTVLVLDPGVPVEVLGLTGRGFALDARGVAQGVADGTAAPSGPPAQTTAPVDVVVSDCVVEVQAPRRLVLEVQRGDERLEVPVALDRPTVAGLDELVRQTCRRARG